MPLILTLQKILLSLCKPWSQNEFSLRHWNVCLFCRFLKTLNIRFFRTALNGHFHILIFLNFRDQQFHISTLTTVPRSFSWTKILTAVLSYNFTWAFIQVFVRRDVNVHSDQVIPQRFSLHITSLNLHFNQLRQPATYHSRQALISVWVSIKTTDHLPNFCEPFIDSKLTGDLIMISSTKNMAQQLHFPFQPIQNEKWRMALAMQYKRCGWEHQTSSETQSQRSWVQFLSTAFWLNLRSASQKSWTWKLWSIERSCSQWAFCDSDMSVVFKHTSLIVVCHSHSLLDEKWFWFSLFMHIFNLFSVWFLNRFASF